MTKLSLLILFICLFACSSKSAESAPPFSVPFEIIDNRPFVNVETGGKTFHFILDTGAFNAIDADAAKSLNLKESSHFQTGGVGENTTKAWTTGIDSFSVGGKTFGPMSLTALSLKNIKEGLKLPYLDGILGYGFFGKYVVQFDYPNKTVSFLDSYQGSNPIPFTFENSFMPKIKVSLDEFQEELILDTGDRSALTLSKNVFDQLQNKYSLSEEKITGYGVGGPVYAKTFNLSGLKMGDKEMKDIPARIPTTKSGLFAQSSFHGSFGGGILKNYKLTVDYKNNLLYLE